MPNLKEVKVRIKSIKSTQKITQAMKLVAASKVRKIQDKVFKSRPYTETLNNIVAKTVCGIAESDRQEIALMKKREVKSVGLVIISSDRGLCGSYNTNILKKSVKRVMELEEEGKTAKLITIGNKATGFFRRTNKEILDTFTQLPNDLSIELASLIAQTAKDAFLNGDVDAVEVIGTDFVSMLRSDIYQKGLLPITDTCNSTIDNGQVTTESPKSEAQGPKEILFEPSLDVVLERILNRYLTNVIYHGLLEAQCSELASRMNAMSSASNNARDIIDRLTIVYNKARQAAITQEISEIVAGAEALA